MAIVVLTIAVVHAAAPRAAPAGRSVPALRRRQRDMIEVTHHGDVAILHMAHGKANAMSIEFCRTLTDAACRIADLAGVGRGAHRHGPDFLGRRRSPTPARRRHALHSRIPPGHECDVRHGLFLSEAGGGCDQRACHRGRVRAGLRRRPAADGERAPAASVSTELLVGVPFPAIAMEIMRSATAPQYFEEAIFSGATFTPDEALGRGMVNEVTTPDHLLDRAVAAARTLAAFVADRVRSVEAADPPSRARSSGAKRTRDRRRGHADLVRARHARPHPGLRRAHTEEGLSVPRAGPQRMTPISRR